MFCNKHCTSAVEDSFFLAFYSSLGMRGIYYLEGFLFSMLKTSNHLMQENDGRSGFYCFMLTYDGYFSSALPYN